jgi:hypothetical protein
VDVSFGDSESLTLSADDNLLPIIETVVQNEQLIIRTKNDTSITSSNPIRAAVTMKSLRSAGISGSGSFVIPELSGEAVKFDVLGSGDITADGAVNTLEVNVGGSGTVNCAELAAKSATVSIGGSGNVTVNASDRLDATIGGSGTIVYAGNPATVNQSVPGSGSINPLP